MHISQLQNKKILVLGYGKEGKATEQFLKTKVPSATIIIADQTKNPNYLEKQFEADIVIKTPSIPIELLKVPYTTATNIFFANDVHFKIGVTGSKGKSTTSSLLYSVLKEAGKNVYLIGNIGTPMIEYLTKDIEDDAIFVIEMSSYQLVDIQYSPDISLIVSLFPDHINHHGTVENYYEAKHHIIAHAKSENYYVYNPEFPLLKEWANKSPCKTISFIEEMPEDIKEIPLLGEHNKSNIRGVITVAQILDIAVEHISTAIKNFIPLPHRLQPVGMFKDIIFYDDAISTTPESTIAAINSLPKIGTILLGGQNRGYDFTELVNIVLEKNIENVVLFPDSGEAILQAFQSTGKDLPTILQTDSMEAAVKFAFNNTSPGSICLLSTASPSYTLWKNFEEKGDMFQLYIRQFGNEER